MSGKWTKGPWTWDERAREIYGPKKDGEICIIYEGGLQFEVDAHLIAAAPELYEALDRALNFIVNTESEIGETLPCGELARAALRKARGEA